VADVPAEGALVLPQQRLAVVRQGGDFFAIDLTCTHLACTVKATEQGFACPCHGSRFGSGGQVLTGPAPRTLRRLRLERRGGVLWITRA
jgi:Rieske Fe-S protein